MQNLVSASSQSEYEAHVLKWNDPLQRQLSETSGVTAACTKHSAGKQAGEDKQRGESRCGQGRCHIHVTFELGMDDG